MWNRFVFSLFYIIFKALKFLLPSKRIDLNNLRPGKILVFSTAGIGDTLSDSPAIRALKETYPEARVVVVTHRRRAQLVEHNPFIDEIITYRKGFLTFLITFCMLKSRGFDLVVVLRANDPDIWPLAWLVNRHALVSYPGMTRMNFLISHPVRIPEWSSLHGVEQTLEIVRYAGADTEDKRLVYKVRREEMEAVQKMLLEMGAGGRDLVAFQVGGGKRHSFRDWGYKNYIILGKKLLDEFNVAIVLTGGKDNLEKSLLIEKGIGKGVVNLTGRLPLNLTAALLRLGKILVSTDTGIMHLGFAVGEVDVLALLHSCSPASRIGPYGYGDKHRVIQLEPPPGHKPSFDISMDLLTPEEVYRRLRQMCIQKGIKRKEG